MVEKAFGKPSTNQYVNLAQTRAALLRLNGTVNRVLLQQGDIHGYRRCLGASLNTPNYVKNKSTSMVGKLANVDNTIYKNNIM